MTDVEELNRMLAGEFDKARFDAILAKYVDMVPWMVIDIPARYRIFRGRPMQGDDLLYMNRKEISYPPAEYAPLNRVSYEHHPMFYASVLAGGGGEYPWLTIAKELDVFAVGDGRKDITFGIWENYGQLRLAALPFSSKYKEELPKELANIQKVWEREAEFYMPIKEIEIATFFSDLLTLPGTPKIYQFTAGFFEFFLNHSEEGKELDGVAYISVPSEGKGFNICLRPEVADRLDLVGARHTMFYKEGTEISRVVYLEADTKCNPWKWRVDPYSGVDKMPEPLHTRFIKDEALFRKEVKASHYNRGRTKLVKKQNI